MNLTALRAARPELLFTAAKDFARAAAILERVGDRISTEVRRPLAGGSWRGSANAAALAYIGSIQRRLAQAQDRMDSASRAVSQFAEALAKAKRLLADAERIAERAELTLGDDGTVTGLPWSAGGLDPQVRQRLAEDAARLLGQALTMATGADTACARVLSGATGITGPADGSAGDGGSSIWSDLYNGAGWVTNAISTAAAINKLLPGVPAVPAIPGATPFGIYGNARGTIEGVLDLFDQGNPVRVYHERGSDYAADWAETGFNASAVAFVVAPTPATALAVVGTAAAWGVSAHWNHIPFHDNMEDAAEQVGVVGRAGAAMADDAWDAGWDAGEDAVGGALDAGGDVLGGIADGVGGLLG